MATIRSRIAERQKNEQEEILTKIKQRKEFLESLLLLEDKSGINVDLAVGIRLDEINAIIGLFEE